MNANKVEVFYQIDLQNFITHLPFLFSFLGRLKKTSILPTTIQTPQDALNNSEFPKKILPDPQIRLQFLTLPSVDLQSDHSVSQNLLTEHVPPVNAKSVSSNCYSQAGSDLSEHTFVAHCPKSKSIVSKEPLLTKLINQPIAKQPISVMPVEYSGEVLPKTTKPSRMHARKNAHTIESYAKQVYAIEKKKGILDKINTNRFVQERPSPIPQNYHNIKTREKSSLDMLNTKYRMVNIYNSNHKEARKISSFKTTPHNVIDST